MRLPGPGLGLAGRHVDGRAACQRDRCAGRLGAARAGRGSGRAAIAPDRLRQAGAGHDRVDRDAAGSSIAYRALDIVGGRRGPDELRVRRRPAMTSTGIPTQVGWPAATDDRSGNGAYGPGEADRKRPVEDLRRRDIVRSRHADAPFGTLARPAGAARDPPGTGGLVGRPRRSRRRGTRRPASLVTYRGSWKVPERVRVRRPARYASAKGASVTFPFSGRRSR